jgi:hypothetical protein
VLCSIGFGIGIISGSTDCIRCQAGSYSASPSAAMCSTCNPGHVQPNEGQAECGACAPGTVQPNAGQGTCSQCDAGTKQPSSGKTACEACDAGYHQPASGSTTCVPCPSGTVLDGETDTCVPCAPFTSSSAGATSCAFCAIDRVLAQGLAASTASCLPCPPGAICGWNTTLATLNLTAGWWRVSGSTTEIHRCNSGGDGRGSCSGGNHAAANGDGYCAEGFSGPLYALASTFER